MILSVSLLVDTEDVVRGRQEFKFFFRKQKKIKQKLNLWALNVTKTDMIRVLLNPSYPFFKSEME